MQGSCDIFKEATGQMRAGALQHTAGTNPPSFWLRYNHVTDCDANAANASPDAGRRYNARKAFANASR